MGVMEFQVCRRGREARWVVTLGNAVYGAYLDKEQALLDAVDAARDALQAGREAQVWVRDRATAGAGVLSAGRSPTAIFSSPRHRCPGP